MYTLNSLLEGLAMFTVPFAVWEKLLLSFYLLNLILAADLSVNHSSDRNETNHALSFASWSENADDDYPGAIHHCLFTRVSWSVKRLWKQPEQKSSFLTVLLDSGVSEISQTQSPKLQLHSIKFLLEAKGSNFLGKVSLPQPWRVVTNSVITVGLKLQQHNVRLRLQ